MMLVFSLVLFLTTIACTPASGNSPGTNSSDSDTDTDTDADNDTDSDSDVDSDADVDSDSDSDTDSDTDNDTDSDTDSDTENCGYDNQGTVLQVADNITMCLPPVVCTAETCPPEVGTCVNGVCEFIGDYKGLETLPEAWATHYCDLPSGACHGVTQINYPEVTAGLISDDSGFPLCGVAGSSDSKCIGIVASSPMVVGNSQEAVDPDTGNIVSNWGLGMTEATGLCYEVTGPGGTAIVAVTDRCGGYCSCLGSGYQECGPCVNAEDMSPNCPCVGDVPGLFDDCCGVGCPTVEWNCDWCASNNHPHFDLDTDAFNWVCGDMAKMGSCLLSHAKFVPCLNANSEWPPGGSGSECLPEDGVFYCDGVPPSPDQPVVPGTPCCCNWGLLPQGDGTCA